MDPFYAANDVIEVVIGIRFMVFRKSGGALGFLRRGVAVVSIIIIGFITDGGHPALTLLFGLIVLDLFTGKGVMTAAAVKRTILLG